MAEVWADILRLDWRGVVREGFRRKRERRNEFMKNKRREGSREFVSGHRRKSLCFAYYARTQGGLWLRAVLRANCRNVISPAADNNAINTQLRFVHPL